MTPSSPPSPQRSASSSRGATANLQRAECEFKGILKFPNGD